MSLQSVRAVACLSLAALLLALTAALGTPSIALAHSGRTDAAGGHWETATGTYHFHNGGSNSSPGTYADSSGGGGIPGVAWVAGLGVIGLAVFSANRKK